MAQTRYDEADGSAVEVAVQDELLEVGADSDNGLGVVVAEGGQRPEEGERRELGERDHEASILHVRPQVVVFPVVFVTANEREHLDVRTRHPEAGEGLGAEGAVEELDLFQPGAVVTNVPEHPLHLLVGAEVLQGDGTDVFVSG